MTRSRVLLFVQLGRTSDVTLFSGTALQIPLLSGFYYWFVLINTHRYLLTLQSLLQMSFHLPVHFWKRKRWLKSSAARGGGWCLLWTLRWTQLAL